MYRTSKRVIINLLWVMSCTISPLLWSVSCVPPPLFCTNKKSYFLGGTNFLFSLNSWKDENSLEKLGNLIFLLYFPPSPRHLSKRKLLFFFLSSEVSTKNGERLPPKFSFQSESRKMMQFFFLFENSWKTCEAAVING